MTKRIYPIYLIISLIVLGACSKDTITDQYCSTAENEHTVHFNLNGKPWNVCQPTNGTPFYEVYKDDHSFFLKVSNTEGEREIDRIDELIIELRGRIKDSLLLNLPNDFDISDELVDQNEIRSIQYRNFKTGQYYESTNSTIGYIAFSSNAGDKYLTGTFSAKLFSSTYAQIDEIPNELNITNGKFSLAL